MTAALADSQNEYIVTAKDGIILRESSSISSKRITNIPFGSIVFRVSSFEQNDENLHKKKLIPFKIIMNYIIMKSPGIKLNIMIWKVMYIHTILSKIQKNIELIFSTNMN